MIRATTDSEYLLSFLAKLLNTPSATSLAISAVAFTQQPLMVVPELSLTRTHQEALVARWMGDNFDTPHVRNPLSAN